MSDPKGASGGVRDILESDWKVLRRLHPIALERFCGLVLTDVSAIASRNERSQRERYLEIYKLVTERDRELGKLFDDLRRSTALIQLRLICSQRLLTNEEIAHFSPEMQTICRDGYFRTD